MFRKYVELIMIGLRDSTDCTSIAKVVQYFNSSN